jgi:hypothetical protein
MYAAARIDVRFGVGEGCKRLGGDLCCATCSTLDQKSPEHMHVLRSVFFIMAKEDQFTWLTPYTFEYFLHTQKYFDEDSEVRVPAVSGIKKVYKGAEAILEYYTLQGYNFNPRSYRHYAALYETSDDEYISEPDGLRMRQLHLDPQVNLGVQSDDIWAKWPDFSHAVFDNTTAFMPFRLLFHDFRHRQPRRLPDAEPCPPQQLRHGLAVLPDDAGAMHRGEPAVRLPARLRRLHADDPEQQDGLVADVRQEHPLVPVDALDPRPGRLAA